MLFVILYITWDIIENEGVVMFIEFFIIIPIIKCSDRQPTIQRTVFLSCLNFKVSTDTEIFLKYVYIQNPNNLIAKILTIALKNMVTPSFHPSLMFLLLLCLIMDTHLVYDVGLKDIKYMLRGHYKVD